MKWNLISRGAIIQISPLQFGGGRVFTVAEMPKRGVGKDADRRFYNQLRVQLAL
jgi:hypothetical protein